MAIFLRDESDAQHDGQAGSVFVACFRWFAEPPNAMAA